ncbi:putative uncharacterized protein DDB_G0282133 [Ctenocephalides felis]|uniref:putative uncharacterized protein DDB_G0282133 n=1 Tax=Ctenocephalides felis TaxID=7515 RepID=UPI000E6E50BB|nr:putative uncharacterized protein DDB_G0282133 [Ctenocephalides felis]
MSLSEEIVLPSGSSLDYTLECGSNTEIDKSSIINDRKAASPKLLQVSTIGKYNLHDSPLQLSDSEAEDDPLPCIEEEHIESQCDPGDNTQNDGVEPNKFDNSHSLVEEPNISNHSTSKVTEVVIAETNMKSFVEGNGNNVENIKVNELIINDVHNVHESQNSVNIEGKDDISSYESKEQKADTNILCSESITDSKLLEKGILDSNDSSNHATTGGDLDSNLSDKSEPKQSDRTESTNDIENVSMNGSSETNNVNMETNFLYSDGVENDQNGNSDNVSEEFLSPEENENECFDQTLDANNLLEAVDTNSASANNNSVNNFLMEKQNEITNGEVNSSESTVISNQNNIDENGFQEQNESNNDSMTEVEFTEFVTTSQEVEMTSRQAKRTGDDELTDEDSSSNKRMKVDDTISIEDDDETRSITKTDESDERIKRRRDRIERICSLQVCITGSSIVNFNPKRSNKNNDDTADTNQQSLNSQKQVKQPNQSQPKETTLTNNQINSNTATPPLPVKLIKNLTALTTSSNSRGDVLIIDLTAEEEESSMSKKNKFNTATPPLPVKLIKNLTALTTSSNSRGDVLIIDLTAEEEESSMSKKSKVDGKNSRSTSNTSSQMSWSSPGSNSIGSAASGTFMTTKRLPPLPSCQYGPRRTNKPSGPLLRLIK